MITSTGSAKYGAGNKNKKMSKINAYVCPHLHTTVTIEYGDGNTSFMMSCPKCLKKGVQELATSQVYKVNQNLTPTHEWYKPTAEEIEHIRKSSPDSNFRQLQQHVMRGGLLLRELSKKTVK